MNSPTEHYTVLARRFRPQTFDDVIGQQHVAQSLKNAIRASRVAHAYLFTGARGVGKTSMARILAKALNCPTAVDGVPCNSCEICDGIAAGNDIDVQEIDGASNNGVDDIRELRANVNIKAMRTEHKVYIIDEVHMLSKSAFNALLKTLEEPPPNVKFVFCTTEPNKLPDTILSRCQRFDFSTIEAQNIVMRLSQIAEVEGYDVDAEALDLVARRAAGSMRDSQSLFDQLLAFGEAKITAADVHRLLGTAADDRLFSIVNAMIAKRRDLVLEELDAAITAGVELGELAAQLVNYFRDLMILAGGADNVALLGVADSSREQLRGQAHEWGLAAIVAALEVLVETKTRMFRASYGRALLEMALIRISMLADLPDIDLLIRGLKDGALPAMKSRPAPAAKTAPAPSSPPVSQSPLTSPPPQPVEASISSPEDALIEENPAPNEPISQPPVSLTTENVSQLWSQVMSQTDDATRSHLVSVPTPAISGPNQLDLLFPASYHFSKQFCDRPEVRGRLERVVENVVGRPVRLVMCVAAKDPTQQNEPTPIAAALNPKVSRNKLLKMAENDPYVEEALTVFNGTLRDAREISTGGPPASEAS